MNLLFDSLPADFDERVISALKKLSVMESFKCPYCPKEFPSLTNLVVHLMAAKNDHPQFYALVNAVNELVSVYYKEMVF